MSSLQSFKTILYIKSRPYYEKHLFAIYRPYILNVENEIIKQGKKVCKATALRSCHCFPSTMLSVLSRANSSPQEKSYSAQLSTAAERCKNGAGFNRHPANPPRLRKKYKQFVSLGLTWYVKSGAFCHMSVALAVANDVTVATENTYCCCFPTTS